MNLYKGKQLPHEKYLETNNKRPGPKIEQTEAEK